METVTDRAFPNDLHDVPIGEAFRRFVVDHQTVKRLAEEAINQKPIVGSTLRGECFGAIGRLRWPVVLTVEALEYSACNTGIYFIGEPDPPPPPKVVSDAIAAFHARYEAFFSLLRSGAAVARDEWGKPVPLGRWGRPDMFVDFQVGDLLERSGPQEKRFAAGLIWTGKEEEAGPKRKLYHRISEYLDKDPTLLNGIERHGGKASLARELHRRMPENEWTAIERTLRQVLIDRGV